jgi:predicted metal-dependent hydrolase
MGPQTLRYGDSAIPYKVSRRQEVSGNIAIHVHSDGTVEVDAPEDASPKHIRAAVRKRARWLTTHVEKIRDRQRDVLPRRYVSGESHFYLGRRYLLKVIDLSSREIDPCMKPSVKLKGGQLQVRTKDRDQKTVKKLLNEWYRVHAIENFERRLAALIDRTPWVGKNLPPVKLITMKRNWGSCSPSGSIVLNPHLVKAPRDCIEYVLLHELCHLKEHNHSKQFFRLMDRVCDGWADTKRRLDDRSELYLNV